MESYQWEAIHLNDPTYDGEFYYALKSTGTFCRPSCPSRTPNKKNVQIYYDAKEALNDGYRACKRCQPDILNWKGSRYELVKQVETYILQHYDEKLTLNHISTALSINSHHLHRTFKLVTGSTPLQFSHQVRIEKAKELLTTSSLSATHISFKVGYSSLSHFSKVFKDKEHISPSSFRNHIYRNSSKQ
ncbi:bifunctional transcriptional activator/DNA repair enzyme AdaA [Niallia circulans]|uniref:bifunctional transcriptional activator/DNA repair enzyme AdaA n=1 Tax=Niallia circulans TaxID=1397 RepID=UPI00069D2D52|nr:Ada metal-binding domain-containing protein [Niallia circulans]HEO8420407.1 methylphosphotriester-DNA--protein-cysteine methyltransferase family protein [Yersinia enterocolitica]